MGANIWFWLIYVLVGIFGIFAQNPWRPAGPIIRGHRSARG